AVAALGEWLADDDPARSLAARQALQRIVESDVPRVAGAAEALLGPGPPVDETIDQPRSFAPRGKSPQSRPGTESPGDRFMGSLRKRRSIVYAAIGAVLVGGGVAAALLIP